jgi:hypothetical protein
MTVEKLIAESNKKFDLLTQSVSNSKKNLANFEIKSR